MKIKKKIKKSNEYNYINDHSQLNNKENCSSLNGYLDIQHIPKEKFLQQHNKLSMLFTNTAAYTVHVPVFLINFSIQ